jgi:hypothetical protein
MEYSPFRSVASYWARHCNEQRENMNEKILSLFKNSPVNIYPVFIKNEISEVEENRMQLS